MKIALVHGRYFNSWEALGLGYIGAYLKSHVKDIEVEFYQGCFDDEKTIIEGCVDADIVAFSCTTPTFPYALRIARAFAPYSWLLCYLLEKLKVFNTHYIGVIKRLRS